MAEMRKECWMLGDHHYYLSEMAGDSEIFWKGALISEGYPENMMAGNVHQHIVG